MDGDVDTSDPKSSEMGEFVPDPTGKKKIKTKVQKESLSDWRGDLREVMTDTKDLKKVKETDRLAVMARQLKRMGAKLDEHQDGLTIYGGNNLKGCQGSHLQQ